MSKTTESCVQAGVNDQKQGNRQGRPTSVGPVAKTRKPGEKTSCGASAADPSPDHSGNSRRLHGHRRGVGLQSSPRGETDFTPEGDEPALTPDPTTGMESSAATVVITARRTKITGLYNRRRQPGEVPTPATAIQNQCRECMGWDADGCGTLTNAIRQCSATECWLWPWRVRGLDPEAWER